MYRQVNISKRINGQELERVLLASAQDVGLKATSVDNYREIYNLNPVEKNKKYIDTTITLKKRLFSFISININKHCDDNWFFLDGRSFNTGSRKRKVEEYLTAVYQRIS